ncbi:MAG: bifunctional hydroxymethylpyrimidine kinase/phosphomethylpyrimidine kinase [Chloroflexi bacterium]|nr:bifunctional hydroxymethylpyrimidine kinase/phosphomethylpyrimidine kinase [Chloroflexota bacterium]
MKGAVGPGQIISLGSINVDFQVRAACWPNPGETLLGSEFLLIGGGKAANVAYLARRLGAPARLVGRVGDDSLRVVALRPLQAAGVDLTHTRSVVGCCTGMALIVVRPDGEKAIILAPNANMAWSDQDAEAVAVAVAEASPGSVLVADLEVPGSIVRRAVEAARHAGHTVVLDPSPAEALAADLCPAIDYLTPNAGEAEELTGIAVRSVEDAFRAGEILHARGVRVVLVKLREGGCALVSAARREYLPAPRVEVVDKTGAGDAFAGALGVALLEGQSEREAGRFAVAAATLAVTRYGSQPAYPGRAELEELLRP